MPFIYAIKIHTDTKDDVNKKFRASKLEGEVIVRAGAYSAQFIAQRKPEPDNHRSSPLS